MEEEYSLLKFQPPIFLHSFFISSSYANRICLVFIFPPFHYTWTSFSCCSIFVLPFLFFFSCIYLSFFHFIYRALSLFICSSRRLYCLTNTHPSCNCFIKEQKKIQIDDCVVPLASFAFLIIIIIYKVHDITAHQCTKTMLMCVLSVQYSVTGHSES